MASREVFHFDKFTLDVQERRLLRGAEAVRLSPKAYDVLVALVRQRGHLVTKDELLTRLWPGSFVEEGSLNVYVSALRKALGEDAHRPIYIETVARSGYRFIAAVTCDLAHEKPLTPSAITRPVELYELVGRGRARADLDLTWLKPFVSFSSAHTSARPNAEIDLRARHHPRTYTAGTTIKIASRTSIGIVGRRTTETYDEGFEFRGEDLARSLDTKVKAYETSFNVDLTPFTTFSLVGSREEQRFERAPERDADSFRLAPTLTFSPLGLITGSASFGFAPWLARATTIGSAVLNPLLR